MPDMNTRALLDYEHKMDQETDKSEQMDDLTASGIIALLDNDLYDVVSEAIGVDAIDDRNWRAVWERHSKLLAKAIWDNDHYELGRLINLYARDYLIDAILDRVEDKEEDYI